VGFFQSKLGQEILVVYAVKTLFDVGVENPFGFTEQAVPYGSYGVGGFAAGSESIGCGFEATFPLWL
jgi:hypothetical protein